jgi:hypothetical protein
MSKSAEKCHDEEIARCSDPLAAADSLPDQEGKLKQLLKDH